MELPSLTTVSGMFTYYIAFIVLLALAFALYIVAGYLGLVPDPTRIAPWPP
ncbi:hypothetical protein ACFQPA_18305 [Halomarina halobia]|uniref:Uncharacterized protein n=1 Tax=Halomarina halobia TaxID=3033386 RepID=A0ABD6ACX0_9EURY|nr:hypothetical protein [Halomarina sp. PSR21]